MQMSHFEVHVIEHGGLLCSLWWYILSYDYRTRHSKFLSRTKCTGPKYTHTTNTHNLDTGEGVSTRSSHPRYRCKAAARCSQFEVSVCPRAPITRPERRTNTTTTSTTLQTAPPPHLSGEAPRSHAFIGDTNSC